MTLPLSVHTDTIPLKALWVSCESICNPFQRWKATDSNFLRQALVYSGLSIGVLQSKTLDILTSSVVLLVKGAWDTTSALPGVLIKGFKVMILASSLDTFSGKCPRFHLCLEVTSSPQNYLPSGQPTSEKPCCFQKERRKKEERKSIQTF